MSRIATLAALAVVLAFGAGACGGDDGVAIDAATDAPTDAAIDAAADAPTGPLTLTSPVLTEGASFMADNTCNGTNVSPALDWINAPVGTMSLAVVLTDTTPGVNLIHWVIYDIPARNTGLPADVDKTYQPLDVPGAHQTKSFNATVTGYQGPCPPSLHTYELKLYALDAPTLQGANAATTRQAALALLMMHDLATATLNGKYMQP